VDATLCLCGSRSLHMVPQPVALTPLSRPPRSAVALVFGMINAFIGLLAKLLAFPFDHPHAWPVRPGRQRIAAVAARCRCRLA
jgi:hypothetical protein